MFGGRGLGLTGILIVIAVLYFSGAGAWLWGRVKELDASCYAFLQQIGTDIGTPACDGVARGIQWLDQFDMQSLGSVFGGQGGEMGLYANNLLSKVSQGNESLASLTSSGNRLLEMMDNGPVQLPGGAAAGERLRSALDQFVIGQHYLQKASPGQGVQWLQSGAQQPGGYGILSQLTLGDVYRSGDYGVSPNMQAARYYYESAQRSLSELQINRTAESRQLLSSIPGGSDQLSRQLQERLQQLR